jgi:hypothetical protein
MARTLGWKVHMRCAHGYLDNTRSMRRCVYRKQLDLETLVATRGPNFPISRLESRLMCPSCGNRQVTLVFDPPSNAQVGRGREDSPDPSEYGAAWQQTAGTPHLDKPARPCNHQGIWQRTLSGNPQTGFAT